VKLHCLLSPNRYESGSLWATDTTGVIFGPVPALGKADNAKAAKEGNPAREQAKPWGDTPVGTYRITGLTRGPHPPEKFGPVFIPLSPVSGVALEGWRNGRTGLAIHGGKLRPDGRLRATFGCLRLTDDDVIVLADLIGRQLALVGEVYLDLHEQTVEVA